VRNALTRKAVDVGMTEAVEVRLRVALDEVASERVSSAGDGSPELGRQGRRQTSKWRWQGCALNGDYWWNYAAA
jgi:hypothetical protein